MAHFKSTIARSILFLLYFVVAQALEESCFYSVTGDTNSYQTCQYGCCYTTKWPCCDSDIDDFDDLDWYAETPFIVGISASFALLLIVISVVVIVRYRRRTFTTIQYGVGGNPQIFSTCTSSNAYMGYGNPGYKNGSQIY